MGGNERVWKPTPYLKDLNTSPAAQFCRIFSRISQNLMSCKRILRRLEIGDYLTLNPLIIHPVTNCNDNQFSDYFGNYSGNIYNLYNYILVQFNVYSSCSIARIELN